MVCTAIIIVCIMWSDIDINECKEGTDNCAHRCENSIGSYKCDCSLGCELASDGVSCDGIVITILNSCFKCAFRC